MSDKQCKSCRKDLIQRSQQKFCSNKCQADLRYQTFLHLWLVKKQNITTINISGHIKRYLLEQYEEKCSQCGWKKKHTLTKKVPLEVDHLDGNANNNHRNNVRLLCPNCHALTPSFRNLNKGNGRSWRKNYGKK